MNEDARQKRPSIDTLLSQLDPLRLKLMENAFENRLKWKPPEIVKTIGPYEPEVFSLIQERQLGIVATYLAKLAEVPDDTIAAMVSDETDAGKPQLQSLFREERDSLDRLIQRGPPRYAGGFGHPDYVANLEYWAKMSSYSRLELTCLSIGIHPQAFPDDKVRRLEKEKQTELWGPIVFLLERFEQLGREFGYQYQGPIVNPTRFLAWAEKVEFEVHPDFWRLLKKYHGGRQAEANVSAESAATKQDKREVDKIAQLFTVMAIETLGYKPDAARSPIPKEIADLASARGISVSDDTVRKYLRRGALFLPSEPKGS